MLFGVACGTAVTVWLELHRTKHESSTVKQHASCWRRCGVCQRLVGTPGSRKQSTSVRFATRQRRDNVNSLKRKDLTARRRNAGTSMQVLTCKAPWAETLDLCLQYCSGAKNCRQHNIKSRIPQITPQYRPRTSYRFMCKQLQEAHVQCEHT